MRMVSWVGLVASAVIPMCACAQEVAPYQPVQQVDGTIRLFGGRFGGFQVHTNKQASIFPLWEAGFRKAQPGMDFANNFSTSSEGALAGLVTGVSDLGPAGDHWVASRAGAETDGVRYPWVARCSPMLEYMAGSRGCHVARPST
jgi:hypothetical protein